MSRAWTTFITLLMLSTTTMGQKFNPVADPASDIVSGNTRVTFLTPRLVRIQWSPDGRFEDRASFAFVNRRLPPLGLDGGEQGGVMCTTSRTMRVWMHSDVSDELAVTRVQYSPSGTFDEDVIEWRPGSKDTRNLKGTVRTLDGVSGSCELEPGLLSRSGWTLVDDSSNLLLDGTNTDWPWATPRPAGRAGAIDWYLFMYGDDYAAALEDFTKVAGKIPLPPKYAFGSWWSRYWAYTDVELKGIVAQFNEHDVPLDVLVIDMDWHLDGWTGYTWNKDYFPDSGAFLGWCKQNNLFVTLNLHPADGVGKHEAMFNQFKAAMGIKDKTCYRVPFDCTDRLFIENYFSLLHHPEEEKGVDFWWMDWQQGTNTKIPGLDPLYWLNYLHWTDFERRSEQGFSLPGSLAAAQTKSYGDKRPLIFSRWGGLGNHRYQIGFSGDTYNNWESLAFQPYFTSTAGNVGYAYWSHDIGGHQPGPVGPELYARWIQYGVFSPILRTHCGKRPDAERRIWAFPEDVFRVCREAFELRYAMLPYTYTACREAYDTGLALCRPLYWHWPKLDRAYESPNQYLFGKDIMVAPVVGPANPVSGVASADVWFPPVAGGWVEWSSGKVFGVGDAGGTTSRLGFALREIPVFVRSGAVIPMQPKMNRTGERPVDPLILSVFDAGPKGAGHGTGTVYEDDGLTSGYERGLFVTTAVSHRLRDGERVVEIAGATGDYEGMPGERAYEVRLVGVLPPAGVTIDGSAVEAVAAGHAAGWWYDSAKATLCVRTKRLDVRRAVRVAVSLSKVDDSPLRAGLIGQLGVIGDLVAVLGADSPQQLVSASGLRGSIATDPAGTMARAAAMQAGWWSFVDAINACSAPAVSKSSALARLLGLSCDVQLQGDDAGKGRVRASADVSFAPRFERAHDLDLAIGFRTSEGWSPVAGEGAEKRISLGIGHHAASAVTVHTQGVPRQGRIDADVVIREGGTEIVLSTHETFCPSVNAWSLLGPFDGPQEDELKSPLISEGRPVDLAARHTGRGGKTLSWFRWERPIGAHDDPRREFFVDFHKAFGAHNDDAVAYAVAYLDAPHEMQVKLGLGSDDGAVVWVNGVEVFRKFIQRGYAPRDDRFEVTLKKGRNELLLKIGQAVGGWGFSVHVDDLAGRPVPGLGVSLSP